MSWRYFDKREFECRCGCGRNKIENAFIDWLDDVRHDAGVPFVVNSGYRCPAYNKTLGNKPEHPSGMAADIACTTSRDRFLILNELFHHGCRRIGVAKTFIHCGINPQLDCEVVWLY